MPHELWKAPLVMKKAEPYQETSSRPPNSSVIFGMAVATMVCFARSAYNTHGNEAALVQHTKSREARKMERIRARTIKKRGRLEG